MYKIAARAERAPTAVAYAYLICQISILPNHIIVLVCPVVMEDSVGQAGRRSLERREGGNARQVDIGWGQKRGDRTYPFTIRILSSFSGGI